MAVLDLTTVAAVKVLLGGETTVDDTLIQTLITAVSDGAAIYLNRHTKTEAGRIELYTVEPTKPYVWLRGFPITTVTSIRYSRNRTFTDIDPLDATKYDVINETGEINLRMEALSCMYSEGFLQVTYTGGMAVDTPAFLAAYPRISNAAATEVVNRMNRAKNPDGNIQFGMSGGAAYQKQLEPLEDFKYALGSQRRWLP